MIAERYDLLQLQQQGVQLQHQWRQSICCDLCRRCCVILVMQLSMCCIKVWQQLGAPQLCEAVWLCQAGKAQQRARDCGVNAAANELAPCLMLLLQTSCCDYGCSSM